MAIATNKPVTIVPTSNPPRTTGPSGLITATATTNATGKSAGEMLALLEARLRHDAHEELPIAAKEQRKITQLRLTKLLEMEPDTHS